MELLTASESEQSTSSITASSNSEAVRSSIFQAGTNAFAKRLSPEVDTSALLAFVKQFSAEDQQVVFRQFSDVGGAREVRVRRSGGEMGESLSFRTLTAPNLSAIATRTASVWKKPVTLTRGNTLGSTTVRIHVGDDRMKDTISIAPDQLSVEYLAVAMQAVARLRDRAASISTKTLMTSVRTATRDSMPPSWRSYLARQLATLNQTYENRTERESTSSILMRPLDGK